MYGTGSKFGKLTSILRRSYLKLWKEPRRLSKRESESIKKTLVNFFRIRNLYKKALIVPLIGVDQLMEEYKQWETSLGDSGKECDFLPAHESALRKLESRMKFEEVISDTVNEFGKSDESQLPQWQDYINFEKVKVGLQASSG